MGVVVPDLPGCFSAGDTVGDAVINASEAITGGWIRALSEVDASVLSDKAERINITLPARVLRRVDETAGRLHESRSGLRWKPSGEANPRDNLR